MEQAQEPAAVDVLIEALAALVSRARFTAEDNFYDVGGDSLIAVRLAGRLLVDNWHLAVQDVLLAADLGDMASRMRPAQVGRPRPLEHDTDFWLAPIQRDALELRAKNPDLFNLSAVLALPSTTSLGQTDDAIRAVIDAHDMLRMGLSGEARLRQRILGVPAKVLAVHEVAPSDRAGVESIAAAAQNDLSLVDGRPCSFSALTQGSAVWGIIMVVHHIVADGVSWDILVEDLAMALGDVEWVPARSSHYRHWVEHLARLATGAGVEMVVDDWLLHLDRTGATGRDDCSKTVVLRRETERVKGRHAVSDWAAFRSLWRRHGGDLLALSCLNYAVRGSERWGTGVIDVLTDGRSRGPAGHHFARTVGWFSSRGPVAVDPRLTGSPAHCLEATADAASEHAAFRHLYGPLMCFSPDPAMRERVVNAPAADVSLNFRGAAAPSAGGANQLRVLDYAMGPNGGDNEVVRYGLRVACDLREGGFETTWRYPAHAADEVQCLITRFDAALADLMSREHQRG